MNAQRNGGESVNTKPLAAAEAELHEESPQAEGIFSWDACAEVPPWTEPVDGAQLLEELAECLKRHVVLGKFAAETLALWVVHTYGFQLRDVTTYIGLESPQKRCGKTTLLTVLNDLVNRPVVASNISSPAFFRVIAEKQPTLMIDEADTVLHRNDELRGILNAGYRRKTAYVVRVANESPSRGYAAARAPGGGGNSKSEAGSSNSCPPLQTSGTGTVDAANGQEDARAQKSEPVLAPVQRGTRLARYSSWCPKVIATIRHLPETLADRCIVITMHRKKRVEKCERVKDLDGTTLRRKCARFVLDHTPQISVASPEIPPDLNDRAAEIWEPLLAVADLAKGKWPERARTAAVSLAAFGQEETAMGALFFDILTCFFERSADRMFSRDVAAALNGMSDRPWEEMRKGKAITELWLARQLRPYGVRTKAMWIGNQAARGYEKCDFNEAFQRYIPKEQAKRMLEELRAEATTQNVNPADETSTDGLTPETT